MAQSSGSSSVVTTPTRPASNPRPHRDYGRQKKYSVFISSTFEDLREQREAVLKAVLENGHFPLGMELWGAANEQQWQIIQRQIDVADYYVVIIAHRYGSEHKGVSWTEMEYNYAVKQEVPILGFLLDEKAEWSPTWIDKGGVAKKLETFRKKARKKPISFWKDTEDLRTKVVLALGRQIQSTPRVGWIRADQGITSTTANELARLSEENAKLREDNARLTSADHPNLAFVLEAAEVAAYNINSQNDFASPAWRLSCTLRLSVTLKKGVPVGFTPSKVSFSVNTETNQNIPLQPTFSDSKGGTMKEITINGPMSFQVRGSGTLGCPIQDLIDNKSIKLAFAFTPIGYAKQYKLSVSLNFSRHTDSPRWNSSQNGPIELEVVDSPS